MVQIMYFYSLGAAYNGILVLRDSFHTRGSCPTVVGGDQITLQQM
jgi:hypothetical protein